MRGRGFRRIEIVGGEENGNTGRARRFEDFARRLDNRVQRTAQGVGCRLRPLQRQVDNDHSGPLPEAHTTRPLEFPVLIPQVSQVLLERNAKLVGQTKVLGTERRRRS